MLTVETMLLVPLGPIDMQRQIMPEYRNTKTGTTGPLAELSIEPGAMWHASWIFGSPWYVRLEDGTTAEVRPEEES